MDLPDALHWLYRLQTAGIRPGLETTRRLLKALQLPGDATRFLHVAGTNGKGSVCAYLDSILRAAGQRTALFTSPHLVRFNERIRVGGECIPDDEIARGLECLRGLVAGWSPHPTFFELTFALAMDWFDRAGAEWVVLETGMGGRLDSTNAVRPVVSVIAPIAMDHQQWLGDTLAAIAREKAGIVKPGVPVVSAPQPEEAAAVIRQAATAAGAPLRIVGDDLPPDWTVPLAGAHQRRNAALAVAALEAAGLAFPPKIVRAGLAATAWPARFQILEAGRLVLDGAHNPHGAALLADTWRRAFPGESARLVFGAVSEKDYRQSLELLAPIAADARFVTVRSPRAAPADDLLAAWRQVAPRIPAATATLPETLAARRPDGPRLLVAGSLFLCGETLALLHGGNYQISAQ